MKKKRDSSLRSVDAGLTMTEKTFWRKTLHPKRLLIGFVIVKLLMGLQNVIYKKPTFPTFHNQNFNLGTHC